MLVSGFLEHRRRMVRREAIRALGRLDAGGFASAFIAALSDESPRVTHAARDVLRANPALVDYDVIADAARSVPYMHGRIDVLRIGEVLGKWPSLLFWLDAAEGADEAIAREVRGHIARWIAVANRRAVPPKSSQVMAIAALIDRCSTIDVEMRGRIGGLLQPWIGHDQPH